MRGQQAAHDPGVSCTRSQDTPRPSVVEGHKRLRSSFNLFNVVAMEGEGDVLETSVFSRPVLCLSLAALPSSL